MRFFTRCSMVAALVALVGSGLWPAGSASATAAGPSDCLPGGACVAIGYTGDTSDIAYHFDNVYPPIELSWHIAVSGGALASATLVTHDDPSVLAVDWPVYVNGAILDPSAVTKHGTDLTIELASVMPVPAGGSLDIRYDADVWPVTANLTSTVALTFDDAAHTGPATAVSPPAVRHVELPDLAVSTATDSMPVPRGMDRGLPISLANHNPKAIPLEGGVFLDFPPGFSLGKAAAGTAYDSPRCERTGPRQWRCGKPHTGGAWSATLDIAAASNLRPGTSGRLRLYARGADANPADNTSYVTLTATGIADLRIRIEPPAGGSLPSGVPQTMTVRISNTGPDPATGIVASVGVSDHGQPPQLVVLGTDGRRWPPAQISQRLPIDRLAAHASAAFTLTLIGGGVGVTATVSAVATSASYDAGGASAAAGIQVVAAGQPAALPPTGSLATTGPWVQLPVLLGLAMLLAGLLLMLAARRTARPHTPDSARDSAER